MIHTYSDVSIAKDEPVLSVGYVIMESSAGRREVLDKGSKVIHMNRGSRDITWTRDKTGTMKGEYFASIVAVRAAQECVESESNTSIVVHVDNKRVADAMATRDWSHDAYFPHALFSFLERFREYDIEMVHRANNYRADAEAKTGKNLGRDLVKRQGALS